MTLTAITIPPGIYRNGTDYGAKNRWYDSSLVRYYSGAVRPIGGWQPLKDNSDADVALGPESDEVVRDGFTWTIAAGDPQAAFGSNDTLYHVAATGVVTDITPVSGFLGGESVPPSTTGYGTGSYGISTYGTYRQNVTSIFSAVPRWSFDNWGADLLAALSPADRQLWSYTIGDPAAVLVPNAPTDFEDFIVTPERFVMTVGSSSNPNLIRWSDRENREEWTPAETNEAGSISLQSSGRMYRVGVVQNTVVIVGSTVHQGRYVGPPYVYGFEQMGKDCAPYHEKTVHYTDKFVVWMGRRNFWIFDGQMRNLPCEVMDWIIDELDPDYVSSMHAYTNARYNEVWWFFRSKTSTGDVDKYFTWNYATGSWFIGELARTASTAAEIFGSPLMVDLAGDVYMHELADNLANGAYIESGPLEIGDGEHFIHVNRIIMDTQNADEVSLTLLGMSAPNTTEFTYGPYTYSQPIHVRVGGRQLRVRIDGVDDTRWELGTLRMDVLPGGKR